MHTYTLDIFNFYLFQLYEFSNMIPYEITEYSHCKNVIT